MVTVKNLVKTYSGDFTLSVSELTIDKGKVIGILGNNGAGKTTFLRSLLNLVQVEQGIIKINNWKIDAGEKWKEITSSYLDEKYLIDHLTPGEYFQICGFFYRMNKHIVNQQLEKYKIFLKTVEDQMKLIRDLSAGNKKKVGIISAVMVNPRLLILDEPFANLDPSSKIMLSDIICRLNKEENTTIIISSHDLEHINKVSDEIIILENGEIIEHLHNSKNHLQDFRKAF